MSEEEQQISRKARNKRYNPYGEDQEDFPQVKLTKKKPKSNEKPAQQASRSDQIVISQQIPNPNKPKAPKEKLADEIEKSFFDNNKEKSKPQSYKTLPSDPIEFNGLEAALNKSLSDSSASLLNWECEEAKKIGHLCKVYWDGENQWFYARILNYDNHFKKYYIYYLEDNTAEWIDISTESIMVATDLVLARLNKTSGTWPALRFILSPKATEDMKKIKGYSADAEYVEFFSDTNKNDYAFVSSVLIAPMLDANKPVKQTKRFLQCMEEAEKEFETIDRITENLKKGLIRSSYKYFHGEQWINIRVRAKTSLIVPDEEKRSSSQSEAFCNGVIHRYCPNINLYFILFDQPWLCPKWVPADKTHFEVLIDSSQQITKSAPKDKPEAAYCKLCDQEIADLVEVTILQCQDCNQQVHEYCLPKETLALTSLYPAKPTFTSRKQEERVPFKCWDCTHCDCCQSSLWESKLLQWNIRRLGPQFPDRPLIVCFPCGNQYKNTNEFCTICFNLYNSHNKSISDGKQEEEDRMIQCHECDRWIHAQCEGIDENQYIAISNGSHPIWGEEYLCPICRINLCQETITTIQTYDICRLFADPVTDDIAKNYSEVIRSPMDIFTMREKCAKGTYKSLQSFRNDVELMCYNALEYNPNGDSVWILAKDFFERCKEFFAKHKHKTRLSAYGNEAMTLIRSEATNVKLENEAKQKKPEKKSKKSNKKEEEIKIEFEGTLSLELQPNCEPSPYVYPYMISQNIDEGILTLAVDICYICGSNSDNELFLFCMDCGEAYHSYCTNAPFHQMDDRAKVQWRCINCKVCEECCLAAEGDNLVYCDNCDKTFHLQCLDPILKQPPDSSWHCKYCTDCHLCFSSKDKVWGTDKSLCIRCQCDMQLPRNHPLPFLENSCANKYDCQICNMKFMMKESFACSHCHGRFHSLCHENQRDLASSSDAQVFDLCLDCKRKIHRDQTEETHLGSSSQAKELLFKVAGIQSLRNNARVASMQSQYEDWSSALSKDQNKQYFWYISMIMWALIRRHMIEQRGSKTTFVIPPRLAQSSDQETNMRIIEQRARRFINYWQKKENMFCKLKGSANPSEVMMDSILSIFTMNNEQLNRLASLAASFTYFTDNLASRHQSIPDDTLAEMLFLFFFLMVFIHSSISRSKHHKTEELPASFEVSLTSVLQKVFRVLYNLCKINSGFLYSELTEVLLKTKGVKIDTHHLVSSLPSKDINFIFRFIFLYSSKICASTTTLDERSSLILLIQRAWKYALLPSSGETNIIDNMTSPSQSDDESSGNNVFSRLIFIRSTLLSSSIRLKPLEISDAYVAGNSHVERPEEKFFSWLPRLNLFQSSLLYSKNHSLQQFLQIKNINKIELPQQLQTLHSIVAQAKKEAESQCLEGKDIDLIVAELLEHFLPKQKIEEDLEENGSWQEIDDYDVSMIQSNQEDEKFVSETNKIKETENEDYLSREIESEEVERFNKQQIEEPEEGNMLEEAEELEDEEEVSNQIMKSNSMNRDILALQGWQGDEADEALVYNDTRTCVFCGGTNEQSAKLGRILPFQDGTYSHVNCLRWCHEVKEQGHALYHAYDARTRCERSLCFLCKQRGATVSCCKTCRRTYHIVCALASECILIETLNSASTLAPGRSLYMFCPGHADVIAAIDLPYQTWTPSNPSVCYFIERKDPSNEVEDFAQSIAEKRSDRVFRSGALMIHYLGTPPLNRPSFGHRHYIYPLGFRSSRIFWSMKYPRIRSFYVFEIISYESTESFSEVQMNYFYENLLTIDNYSPSSATSSNHADASFDQTTLSAGKRSLDSVKNGPIFRVVCSDNLETPLFSSSIEKLHDFILDQVIMVNNNNTNNSHFHPNHNRQIYNITPHQFFGLGQDFVRRGIENLSESVAYMVKPDLATRYRPVFRLLDPDEAYKMGRILSNFKEFVTRESKNGSSRADPFEDVNSRFQGTRVTKILAKAVDANICTEITNDPSPLDEDDAVNQELVEEMERENNRIENEKLSQKFLQMSSLYLKDYNANLSVQKSPIHGWGLFAKINFEKEDVIVEYIGEKIRQIVADKRELMYETEGVGSCYLFRLDRDEIIDATRSGGIARFINHCCEPNAYAKVISCFQDNDNIEYKHIVIIAAKNIKEGEEVTYDYKFPIEDVKLKCYCGAPRCAGSMN